jgi:predicted PurR-regulated permease PerM
VLGLFFSVYMMAFRDQLKNQIIRLSKTVFGRLYYRLAFTYKVADGMFNKFLVGKGLCSIGIGIVTFIVCIILGFRYSALISLIIAVTNMVPTFGPLIGAIPAVLLAMMTEPIYGIYILIIIVALQIIEGNIIGPRVLGASLGINGFWIIFSIIIMGGLFGVIGMLIAAPFFGMLRILIKNWVVRKETNGEKLNNAEQYDASMARYRAWVAPKPKTKKSKAS